MNGVAALLRQGVACLARIPRVFDLLRWLLEGGFHSHHRLIARQFRSSPASVLDCGCGTGIFSNCFRPEAYVGIDLSPIYITRARSLYRPYDFRVMDAKRLEFPDCSFEAVIVAGLLHHLDDDDSQTVLKELQRVLKPGGELLIWEDVPARSPWNVIGHVVHRLDIGDHIRAESSYIRLLEPYFTIESSESLQSGCMDYIVFKALPKKAGSELSNRPPVSAPACTAVATDTMPSTAIVHS